jgi:hypothetical protein
MGIDEMTHLGDARKLLGPTPVQGNLDPIVLLCDRPTIKKHVLPILAQGGGSGFISIWTRNRPQHPGRQREVPRGIGPGRDSKMKIAIIGGGLSGLAAAYQAQQDGLDFRLFEASARFGGVVETEIGEDLTVLEAGADSCLSSKRRC